jgi:hypothetical protein
MPEARGQPRLHLDADTSNKALQRALAAHGYDITRTPNAWMPIDADDEMQLLGATAHGRIIFTYNVRDFTELAQRYPKHAGIILAAQRSWTLSNCLNALQRLVAETCADEWMGQVRWLNQWRI